MHKPSLTNTYTIQITDNLQAFLEHAHLASNVQILHLEPRLGGCDDDMKLFRNIFAH